MIEHSAAIYISEFTIWDKTVDERKTPSPDSLDHSSKLDPCSYNLSA